MSRKSIIIIGAGGHGKVVAEIAGLNGYTEIIFLDDNPDGNPLVKGVVAEFVNYIDSSDFFVAVGNNKIRKRIFEQLKQAGANIVTLFHPSAVVSPTAKVGEGVVVMAQAFVGVDAEIGDGAIVNTCASVDHDCYLGDFAHVSAGVHMAGLMRIDRLTFVGVGATVVQNVCSDCLIGAGAVVAKPITESGTYVGVPARKIK